MGVQISKGYSYGSDSFSTTLFSIFPVTVFKKAPKGIFKIQILSFILKTNIEIFFNIGLYGREVSKHCSFYRYDFNIFIGI